MAAVAGAVRKAVKARETAAASRGFLNFGSTV